MCTVCACFVYCLRLLPNKWQRYKEYANSFLFLSIFSASHWQSEIHGDHMLSGTSVIMAALKSWPGICQLWLSVQCCALHGREDGSCRSISSQLCWRSRGACMHGAAVGSWREEELVCSWRSTVSPSVGGANDVTTADPLIAISWYDVVIVDHFASWSRQAMYVSFRARTEALLHARVLAACVGRCRCLQLHWAASHLWPTWVALTDNAAPV